MSIKGVLRPLATFRDYLRLPPEAREETHRDLRGLPSVDPGPERVITECSSWILRAQDASLTHDGGVARHYSLIDGWASSYPETTGYIVPTLLACGSRFRSAAMKARARQMLDWLVAVQLENGAYQGGRIDHPQPTPVTFNTGQVLIGLAAGTAEFGETYRGPMRRAADWLVQTQDPDGGWRRFPSPVARPGERTYDAHVAWGLVEAARLDPGRGYAEAARANVRWAIRHQGSNGWFDRCCLTDNQRALTHTIGYAVRGVLEMYRLEPSDEWLRSARRAADGFLPAMRPNGFLPGRLRPDWSPAANYACLTGSSQLASCLFLLYWEVRDERYLDAARRLNAFVRRTIKVEGHDNVRGAAKGSFPVGGAYEPYRFLNWAAKFTIDAALHELAIDSAARTS